MTLTFIFILAIINLYQRFNSRLSSVVKLRNYLVRFLSSFTLSIPNEVTIALSLLEVIAEHRIVVVLSEVFILLGITLASGVSSVTVY